MASVEHKAVKIIIPADLWEAELAEEAMLTSWHAADASRVAGGAVIAEKMVDKVKVDVQAPASGHQEILVSPIRSSRWAT